MNIQTHTEHRAPVTQRTTTTTTKRGTKINRLRAYLKAGRHLRDGLQGLTRTNVKTQHEIAREIGLRSRKDVCYLIRREFPEIAEVMAERNRYPDQRAPKKERFFRYMAAGKHLRNPNKAPDAQNLRTQTEIALAVGTNQPRISKYIREYFPDIAAIMATRRRPNC